MAKQNYQTETLNACGLYPEHISIEEWDNIAGMEREKQLIESKILLPLLNHELAKKHGVSTPKVLLLFGPPGTGKTSFARGIASKLGWSFIEVSPSQLICDGLDKQAFWLRTVFGELQGVDKAVIFFDEFEQMALRPDQASPVERMVSSEMLRQLPRFRTQEEVLLVCATNNIKIINPALLRVGRFDYILPIGAINAQERQEVFSLYLKHMNTGEIDLGLIAQRAERYTPADIEAVCTNAAQSAFEKETTLGSDYKLGTEDLLQALENHKATISEEDLGRFQEDIDQFCRADYCRLLLEDE
ncbi:MAG: ATP-binding protein [Dehalococcoidales bacterium]|nr:ATP-binding protein [Dehalococcoidales bacterium]